MKSKEKDQTYGVIRVGTHSTCPARHLFGSNIKHANYVTLRISTAYMAHGDDGCTSVDYPCEDARVVEVMLSLNQWAELLANMNGGYTPCTFRVLNGELLPDAPSTENKLALEAAAASKGMRAATGLTMEQAKQFSEILAKPKLTAADKRRLNDLFIVARGSADNVLDFCLEKYQEVTESIKTEAKVEITAYAQRISRALHNVEASAAIAQIATSVEEK